MTANKKPDQKIAFAVDVKYLAILSKDLEVIEVLSTETIEINGAVCLCIITNADGAVE